MTNAEVTIIGAGVIGLAISEKISEQFNDVFLIEKHSSFGQETSSRNSEVVHAGIYYPRGSLKANLCVKGKFLLYEYCKKHKVPFNNCGKLIVATTPEEIDIIRDIKENSARNGVELDILEKDQITKIEPNVLALKALFSPTTGIVDTHLLMKQFETNTINNGGQIVYSSEVISIKRIEEGYEITIIDADKKLYSFTSRRVINSAGLSSDKISEMAGMKDEKLMIRFCKGEYFRVRPPKNNLIKRLIYPVPHTNMEELGIHVTIDMGGGVKLGPDVTWLKSNIDDYSVDPSKQEVFWNSARKFLPFLEFDDIYPEMAGIRPKIYKQGDPANDFYIKEETARGNAGFINLIGIESPGLTSCLAIADHVLNLIKT